MKFAVVLHTASLLPASPLALRRLLLKHGS